jgi:hypothetical protein
MGAGYLARPREAKKEEPVELVRIIPVPLPAVLEPGEYLVRDGKRVVIALELRESIDSIVLAHLIEQLRAAA